MKLALSLVALALVGLGAVALLGWGPAPADPVPVLVGGPPLEQSALIHVALARDLFAEHGLAVTLREDYTTGVGPVDEMAAGTLDLSVSSEYPVLARILAGDDLCIVATIDKYQNERLVARGDLGIREIADLRGRRIGLARGTILEFFLGRLLERNGLALADVTLVDVAIPHSADAIAAGEVDALMCFEPHASGVEERLGERAVVWPGQGDQSLYAVVAARRDWVERHPGELDRFLRALDEARTWSLAHPDETGAIVRERLNLPDAYAARVWPDHQFTLSLDHSLLRALDDEAHWMVANNLTPAAAPPDLRERLHAEALARVRPEAVNLL